MFYFSSMCVSELTTGIHVTCGIPSVRMVWLSSATKSPRKDTHTYQHTYTSTTNKKNGTRTRNAIHNKTAPTLRAQKNVKHANNTHHTADSNVVGDNDDANADERRCRAKKCLLRYVM